MAERLPAEGALHWFEHTADVGFRVEAPFLDALFARGARGLVALLLSTPPATADARETAELTALSREALLVAWLDEVLFLVQTRRRVPVAPEVRIRRDGDGWSLRAIVPTAVLDPAAHGWRTEVKATTFHGLALRERREGWRADVVFDV